MTDLYATLPGRLVAWAQQRPRAVALREKDLGVWAEVTWAQYRDNVAAVARQLHALGVGPGDHVAILSDNRPEWLYADLAAQALGARSVGVYQTNPAADVAYVLAHCEAKVLVAEDQEQVDKAITCRADTPTVEHVVVIEPRGTRGYEDERLMRWGDLLAAGREALAAEEPGWLERRLAELDPDQPAMIVYTSGTTGQPKGAMLTSRNAVEAATAILPPLGVGAKDTVLSYLPLCHVAEKIFSVFMPMACGSAVHFGESIETVRKDLMEVSPTVFLGVPRIWEKMHANVTLKMRDASRLKRGLFYVFSRAGRRITARRREGGASGFRRVLDALVWRLGDLLVYRPLQERLGLRRCKLAISGAAPISAELIEWFNAIGVPMVEGYGQTECTGVSHLNRPGQDRIGTVGPPAPSVEDRLAEDGEILVRGPMVFAGYLHDADATARTVDADGWLHTGDVGEHDADGYLSITGRKKEIIITAGGKNLSPEKIENALKTSPYIKEAVAIGDRRKFVSALIQIDYDAVGDWASRRNLAYTSYADLAAKDDVLRLVGKELDRANGLLARVEQVRGFKVFPKELHQDDGEMTATQKVRRGAVHEIYAELIESMYLRGSA